jgi:hypothetical protein
VSGCVRVFECALSILPLLGVVSPLNPVLSRVPSSPFIVCKGRDRVTVYGCTKIEKKALRCSLLLAFLLVRAFAQLSSWWWHAVAVDDAAKPYPNTVSGPKVAPAKRWGGAWMTVAPHPIEVEMVGCGVA